MTALRTYTWRGEPIQDIYAWAKERGESMVRYHGERHIPGFNGQMILETDDGEMPESFWNGFGWHNGWSYRETERYLP